jgi:hypothetical protein
VSKRHWMDNTIAVLGWILATLLGLWLFISVRSGLLGTANLVYVKDSIRRARQLKLFDKILSLAGASLWIAFVAISEVYFRKAADHRDLLWRVAIVVGPELLLITITQISLLALQAFPASAGERWLAIGIGSLLGTGCLVAAHKLKSRRLSA